MEVTLGFGSVRLSGLPCPPASGHRREGEGKLGLHLVHPRSKLGFLLGAVGARTADENQLREARGLGERPGPSPAPADPAKSRD